jgi:hypothetical protein
MQRALRRARRTQEKRRQIRSSSSGGLSELLASRAVVVHCDARHSADIASTLNSKVLRGLV